MPNVDLGLVRDLITRIERTSGDGTPGTTDTYTIYTEDHPDGIVAFQVYNGTDGANVIKKTVLSGTSGDPVSVDTVLSYITEDTISVMLTIYSLSSPQLNNTYQCLCVDKNGAGTLLPNIYAIDPSSGDLVAVSSLNYSSGNHYFTIYDYDDSSTFSVDSALSKSSHNAVENMAIANAVSTGVCSTSLALNESDSYVSDTDLADAISNGFPFSKGGIAFKMIHMYSGYAEYEGVEIVSGVGMKRTLISFNTGNSTVNAVYSVEMAQSSDISNLF